MKKDEKSTNETYTNSDGIIASTTVDPFYTWLSEKEQPDTTYHLNMSATVDAISVSGGDLTISNGNYITSTLDDPYAELEERRQEQEQDEELRNEHPSLQEAYDNYQLVKKLVEDNEFDKTFDERYKGFSKK